MHKGNHKGFKIEDDIIRFPLCKNLFWLTVKKLDS